ncbi:hypothetical protein HKCCE3408_07520 [Rhodobacterales bacterium HKCCE3408]|nr:hypothetical protein [Rhodobacterales bacterium HKCCE3408]
MRLTLTLYGPFDAALDGKPLAIASRRSRAMLAMLARAPAGAVSRDRLAATLWPDRAEEQARASLRQELSTLRRAIGDLVTADGIDVRLDRSAVETAGGPEDGDFLDGLDLKSEPFDDWRRAEAAAEAGGPGHDIFENPSVLVLGFVPATDDPDDVAFATGLVIDLRTSLSNWRWFPVIGPEAIGWQTDRDGNLRELAADVGAAYAIGGAIRRAGERIRVSASLTDVESGRLIWSETFDGSMSDIFEMQEAIGRAVVARVTPAIGQAEAARVIRARPADLAAWQLVARTEEMERTGGEGYGTPESNRAQVPLLEQAIAREPGYARAWARLGRYHFRAAMQGWCDDREEATAEAIELCSRAIELDSADWEAQAYCGLSLIFGVHDFQAGRFHTEEAVRLNPSAPVARHGLGCALEWLGELDLALHHLNRVFDLNPNHFNRAAVLGDITTCQILSGQVEPAVETARQLRAIAPNYLRGMQRVVVTLGLAGETGEAAEALERVMALQPGFDADYVRDTYPYARPELLEAIFDGLQRAGWSG